MNAVSYVGRHIAQKTLYAVGFIGLQEWLKALTGRWQSQLSDEFFERRIRAKVRQFSRLELPPGAFVVEQGTGWYGLDPVLLFLGGSSRVDTFDTLSWLKKPLLVRSLRAAVDHIALLTEWEGRSTEELMARARLVEEIADRADSLTLDQMLEPMNIRYRPTREVRHSSIPDSAVDLHYSDSVLQRVVPTELQEMVTDARRMLSSDGKAYHIVDCKDFHAMSDKSIPECWYLTIPPSIYSLMAARYVNYQNRLRMAQFMNIFRLAEYSSLEIIDETCKPENIDFCRREVGRMQTVGGLSPEQIAVSRFELIAVR